MDETIRLRCSGLPLATRCPGSIRRGVIELNGSHPAADDGTAVHEVLRLLPTTDRVDWDSIPDIAKKYGANPEEVRMLTAQALKLWNAEIPDGRGVRVKDCFRGALTEVQMERELAPGVVVTGHGDLVAIAERAFRCGDWKSGRKDRDHVQQYRGYAALALLSSDDIDEVTTTGLWIRDQQIETYTMDRRDAHRWLEELVERVVKWDGVYHPGDHCGFCPRSHECEAANALLRRDVAVIADKALVDRMETELATMEPDEIVRVLRKADMVVRFAERVRAAIKAYVQEKGELVGDGLRLSIETSHPRTLDPMAAWPVLKAAGLTDEDMAAVMKLSISKAEKLVAAKAGRGKGAGAVRELAAKLKECGAVTFETTHTLKEQRA